MGTTAYDVGRSRSARLRVLVSGLVVALSMVLLPGQAEAHSGDAAVAVSLINEARAAYGIHGLTPDPELEAVATRQAQRMAARGYLYHSANLGGQLSWGWSGWAENVGYGPSAWWLHDAFMSSWVHAGNILEPWYNYVGVGVAYGWDGTLYMVQVFGAW